LKPLEMVGLHW